jgi:hypothetical protein
MEPNHPADGSTRTATTSATFQVFVNHGTAEAPTLKSQVWLKACRFENVNLAGHTQGPNAIRPPVNNRPHRPTEGQPDYRKFLVDTKDQQGVAGWDCDVLLAFGQERDWVSVDKAAGFEAPEQGAFGFVESKESGGVRAEYEGAACR